MQVHQLKIWPHFLSEIETGRKTFDLRSNKDRIFQAGDQLMLNAWDPVRGEYIQGRAAVVVDVIAVYAHLPGLESGYVGLSIRKTG